MDSTGGWSRYWPREWHTAYRRAGVASLAVALATLVLFVIITVRPPAWVGISTVLLLLGLILVHWLATIWGWRFVLYSWPAYWNSCTPQKMQRTVVRLWREAMLHAGLYDKRGGKLSVPLPALVHTTPRGTVLTFPTPATSSLYAGLREAKPALESYFATTVDVRHHEGATTVTVIRQDPNAQPRRSRRTSRAITPPHEGSPPGPRLEGETGPSMVIGRDSSGDDVSLNLAKATHIAIQGSTRSGKTSLMYVILSSLAGRRDVAVMGIDPGGALLAPLNAWVGNRSGTGPEVDDRD